jgi:hypothetical protein
MISAYAAAFSAGSPSADALASLRRTLAQDLGPTLATRFAGSLTELTTDASAVFKALENATPNVVQLASRVEAVAMDGAGPGLNPFRIDVRAGN